MTARKQIEVSKQTRKMLVKSFETTSVSVWRALSFRDNIHHRLGNTLYLNGKVAVRLHQRECVLSSEQPCAATVGVQKREDGHLHLHAPPPL